jgi:hypothetical protein
MIPSYKGKLIMNYLMRGLVALTVFWITVSQAATIKIDKATGSGYYISIEGEIDWTDGAKFAQVIETNHITNAIVLLDSPGGFAEPGLEIARTIKNKRFETYVQSGGRCYSSCAIIWLSGNTRFVGRASVIGFHGVYTSLFGVLKNQSFEGNVEVAKHLLRLGLSPETVKTLLTPKPDDLLILKKDNAEKLGISFTLWDDKNIFSGT